MAVIEKYIWNILNDHLVKKTSLWKKLQTETHWHLGTT